MFHYSSYWETWSRVLRERDERGNTVELNLTPIRCCSSSTWDNHVKGGVICNYFTVGGPHDKLVPELPPEILDSMVQNLGMKEVYFLLNEDFLPQIDWEKYSRFNNGGCKFALCQKEM